MVEAECACLVDPLKYRIESRLLPRTPVWGRSIHWKAKDDAMVVVGVHKHGYGNWAKILDDKTLGLHEKMMRPGPPKPPQPPVILNTFTRGNRNHDVCYCGKKHKAASVWRSFHTIE